MTGRLPVAAGVVAAAAAAAALTMPPPPTGRRTNLARLVPSARGLGTGGPRSTIIITATRCGGGAAGDGAGGPPPPEAREGALADATEDGEPERMEDILRLRAARNLLGVLTHLQNPELYPAGWADGARLVPDDGGGDDGGRPTTSRLACDRDGGSEAGEILSLYPIHAVGIRRGGGGDDDGGEGAGDLVLFDAGRDGDCFGDGASAGGGGEEIGGFGEKAGRGSGKDRDKRRRRSKKKRKRSAAYRRDVAPLVSECDRPFRALFGDGDAGRMFIDVNPNRPLAPGWMGHLARRADPLPSGWSDSGGGNGEEESSVKGNCMVVPLPGAAPLYALVAAERISRDGELVLKAMDGDREEDLSRLAAQRHRDEVEELQSYVGMALASPPPTSPDEDKQDGGDKADTNDECTAGESLSPPTSFASPFAPMNLSYPNLQHLHRDPDIYAVDHFLTDEECDRIVAKARPHQIPCLTKDPVTGEVKVDERRSSTNANLPRREVPGVVRKLVELTDCAHEDRLEILQVLRYTEGQRFKEHTDGFDGPTTACGFADSGRLITIFVYLNDVEHGGTTTFPELDLEIKPRKGMAVVHFPATTGLEEDERTLHVGTTAVDEKWLLTTWVWGTERTVQEYGEERLPTLSEDVI